MDRFEIESKIKEEISMLMQVEVNKIRVQDELVDDLGFDSLDYVELCMAVEEFSNCEIPDEDCIKWKTVQDVIDYACQREEL